MYGPEFAWDATSSPIWHFHRKFPISVEMVDTLVQILSVTRHTHSWLAPRVNMLEALLMLKMLYILSHNIVIDTSIPFKMVTMLDLVTNILHSYWLYSPYCTCDSFIFATESLYLLISLTYLFFFPLLLSLSSGNHLFFLCIYTCLFCLFICSFRFHI